MVVQVHGCPPEPADVEDEERPEAREGKAHEQGLEGGVGGVQAGEGTKWHGGGGEARGVHVDSEELINPRKSGRGPGHAVESGLETMLLLVPRRGTGQQNRKGHTSQGEPAERSRKNGSSGRSGEEEEEGGADSRAGEMANTVREPGQNIENGVRVGGEDVGKVGAVKDVFKGGKDLDPNVRAVLYRDKAVMVMLANLWGGHLR